MPAPTPPRTEIDVEALPLPPGSFGLPLLGETLPFVFDNAGFLARRKKLGPVFTTHIFGKPTIAIAGREGLELVFGRDHKELRIEWPPSTRALLGAGSLANLDGRAHGRTRSLLMHAFKPTAMAGYLEPMARIVDARIDAWLARGRVGLYAALRELTFDIAASLLLGAAPSDARETARLFETWTEGLFTLPIDLPFTKFGRARAARRALLARIDALLDVDDAPDARHALSILRAAVDSETGAKLSRAELQDQVLTLLFAGHETLTSALSSFCLLVAQHPDVLSRLRAEQRALDDVGPLSVERLAAMTYLEQVCSEVLRLVPPVGGGFRVLTATTSFRDMRLPKGWRVFYRIADTHHDADLYPDPERFDPERFAQGPPKRGAYAPFGGGPRLCIGMFFARLEMKVLAARLLQRCTWTLEPGQDLRMTTFPVPKLKGGLHARIEPYVSAREPTRMGHPQVTVVGASPA
jgi:cytochrome P450